MPDRGRAERSGNGQRDRECRADGKSEDEFAMVEGSLGKGDGSQLRLDNSTGYHLAQPLNANNKAFDL